MSLAGPAIDRHQAASIPDKTDYYEDPAHLTDTYTFLWHYLKGRKWHFLLLTAAVVSAAGCAVVIQYVMKLLIDAMTAESGRDASAAWAALSLFIGLVVAESLLWRVSGWVGCRATIGVGVDMRLDLFDYLGGHPMRYFAERLAGSLGQRITATAGNFGALCNTVTWRIAPPCIDFVGALIVFTTIDWRMAAALAAFVITVTGGLILIGERGRPVHRVYAGQSAEVAGELTDVISNMWSVKAFSARRRERWRLWRRCSEEARAQQASWLYIEKTRLLYDLMLAAMAAGMLTWAICLWSDFKVTAGDVVIVSALTFRILHGSRDLALSLVDLTQHFGYIEDTLRVIGERPSLTDDPMHRMFRRGGGSIEFRNVSFTYGAPGAEAVHDLNLFIPAGQKLGIVGPSGAGKSTLLTLIQRLYDVQKGQVLINGQPVDSITQDSLRDALAVVPQEISLFHRSVMENIRFGRPDASDEEVFAAAHAAHCDHFIRKLPHGYNTIVGERGTKLSGGQRQRIGIARAFLKNAPIIILDEATSSLDIDSELAIHRSLLSLMRDRTVIAVAHRLSTIAAFDRVLVMIGGTIVDDGPVAELRRRDGPFQRMWKLQSEGLAAAS